MILEITPGGPLGRANAIKMAANQVVVRADNGTPLCLISADGNAVEVVKAGDDGFNAMLRRLGLSPVDCQMIQTPGISGAQRLIRP